MRGLKNTIINTLKSIKGENKGEANTGRDGFGSSPKWGLQHPHWLIFPRVNEWWRWRPHRRYLWGGVHSRTKAPEESQQRETNPSMRPKVETEKPEKKSTSCLSMLSVLSSTHAFFFPTPLWWPIHMYTGPIQDRHGIMKALIVACRLVTSLAAPSLTQASYGILCLLNNQ